MDGEKSRLVYFDGTDYYPLLEIIVKSFVDNSPLNAIIASRAKGKKVKPWVPQEENSIYVGPPQNTVFITDSNKIKTNLSPGSNEIQIPERSLESILLSPYISWHGKEGTLSIKGLKDTTLKKQTSQEYFEDIVPSIKRDDMAANAICIIEAVMPLHAKSYKSSEAPSKATVSVGGLEGDFRNEPYMAEHPTDIVLAGEPFEGHEISALIFAHMGTRLAPWTLERVVDDLICEPITITNHGYKGAVNTTLLLRSLGSIEDDSKVNPIAFSVKSSDTKQQLFFQAFKYGS